jgi:ABC-2 type transport system permease protein
MTRFNGLLRREWLEHRSAFTWGPAVVLIMVVLFAFMAVLANHGDVSITVEQQQSSSELAGSELVPPPMDGDMGAMEILAAMTLDVAGSTDVELRRKMEMLQHGLVAPPFHLVFVIIAVFALLGCLYDERKDASILFWKSMPVSDLATVASKVVFIIWLAPLVTIGAIFAAQFLTLSLVSIYVEDGMAGRIWAASGIWWQPFKLVFAYLQFGLWLLPFAGWIMLVSAAARKSPALWAFGVPVVLVMLEEIVIGSQVLRTMITGHFQAWDVLNTAESSSWKGLTSPRMWGGVALALALLGATVVLRGRNNNF